MCENQLSKLITLKNVADFLQFSQLYLARQLEVRLWSSDQLVTLYMLYSTDNIKVFTWSPFPR
jgi:hypothetical protein